MAGSIIDLFTGLLGRGTPRSRNELGGMLAKAEKSKLISHVELDMLHGVLGLLELRVEDIMIPQGKVSWLHVGNDLDSMLAEVAKTGHSRYPVYNGEESDSAGILHVKDLLSTARGRSGYRLEQSLLRPARKVPESKRLNSMLRDFQKYRVHMVVVADEYGNISGVVTIEDVLERIVGSIRDEFDAQEGKAESAIRPASKTGHWTVDGATLLIEFNRKFGANADRSKSDTVGGWIAHKLGRMPMAGDRIVLAGHAVTVVSVDGRRVRHVDVTVAGLAAGRDGAGRD